MENNIDLETVIELSADVCRKFSTMSNHAALMRSVITTAIGELDDSPLKQKLSTIEAVASDMEYDGSHFAGTMYEMLCNLESLADKNPGAVH